jgi:hypothetical protein
MAAKQKVTRTAAEIRRKGGNLRSLSAKTRNELRILLKRHRAGTISQRDLDTGLLELERDLEKLNLWIHTCP